MIYLGNISTCSEEALLPLVCAERRDYAAKYKQSADKIRSLGVAALLGIALKREGYIDALPVSLTHDEKQKPVLSDMVDITNNPKDALKEQVDIKSKHPYFSLSHAGDYVAVAIDSCPIGIDIERNRPYRASLAKRYFSKEEQELPLSFTQIWTLKESFLKVTGMGLQLGLDSFSVCLDPKWAEGSDHLCKTKETRFSYRQDFDENAYAGLLLDAPDGYAFSVCAMDKSSLLSSASDTGIHYVNLEEPGA